MTYFISIFSPPIKKRTSMDRTLRNPPPNLINGEEEYEVEQVLDARRYGRGRKVQYLIKWKGYPNSDNQWVDWNDLHAEEALEDF